MSRVASEVQGGFCERLSVLTGFLLVFLVGLSVSPAVGLAKTRVLDATASLPASERAMIRVSAGKGQRWCGLKASSGRARTGTYLFRVSKRDVTFTWTIPARARTAVWNVQVNCSKVRRHALRGKTTRLRVKVTGRRNGSKKLVKPGSLKIRSVGWIRRNSSVKVGAGASDNAVSAPCEGCESLAAKDTYYYGYCTWYVATRRTDLGGLGNAYEWWKRTRAPKGSKPVRGAVAWWDGRVGGGYGHVAYVEQVSGNRIRVSEMNWNGWNVRSERWITLGTGSAPHGYIYGGPAGNGPATSTPKPKPSTPPKPAVPNGMVQPLSLGLPSRIAAGRLADGRIVNLTVDGKGQMWERAQTKANSPWKAWQKWGPSTAKWIPKTPVTFVHNADGRLQWFATGVDGQVWTQWRVPNGGWSAVTKTTGNFGGASASVGRLSDGRLVALIVDASGQMWERAQTKANGGWKSWQKWWSGAPKWAPKTPVTMVHNADGRLQWFAKGADGQIWSQWRLASGGWSGISRTGNSFPPGASIAAGRLTDGRIVALTIDATGQMWERAQTKANSSWKSWQKWGASTPKWTPNSPVTLIPNADGRLQWFAIGTNRQIWSQWRVANGGWASIAAFGGNFDLGQQVSATHDAKGRLEIFIRGTHGQVVRRSQTAPNGSWGSYVNHGGFID